MRQTGSKFPACFFLGYSRSLKVLYYYDMDSALVKTATQARFDEGMNDVVDTPPECTDPSATQHRRFAGP
jgi:hypothetical protein